MKIAELIAKKEIDVEGILEARELFERAEFVENAIKACQKTLLFPFGKFEIPCYDYTDSAGEYRAWGSCTINGVFTCYSNRGENPQVGQCDIDLEDLFFALDKEEFAPDLRRFLTEQIEKAK